MFRRPRFFSPTFLNRIPKLLNRRRFRLDMEITGTLQNYAWGKLGQDSLVAQLAASGQGAAIDPGKPYAELWMGTHPNGPSKLAGPPPQTLLADLIKEQPHLAGGMKDLPFLFKVLSVNKALSIQAHPNKAWAQKLHAEKPEIYRDSNHKPEIAIALTPFDALCGFRSLESIKAALREVAPLREAVGNEEASRLEKIETCEDPELEGALRACFVSLMNCPREKLAACLNDLKVEVEAKTARTPDDELFLALVKDYPGDVGCLAIFFLNKVRLEPGEAVFLAANVPHAYLGGDCIECMACSDNVVRAGLTPKMIDVDTLCAILEYKCGSSDQEGIKFAAIPEGPNSTVYDPPVEDFAVARLVTGGTVGSVRLPTRASPSILIFVEGRGKYCVTGGQQQGNLNRGTILFLPAGQVLEVTSSDPGVEVVAYQAFCRSGSFAVFEEKDWVLN